MAGQRSGFVADALHQVAVAAQGINVVVEQRVAGTIEIRGQPALRDRHAHAVADPLAQRAGGRLHARGIEILRMPRAAAAELPEASDFIQRHRQLVGWLATDDLLHAAQVQQGVEQHRGMAAGEHEAVAPRPARIGRIVAEHLVPERVSDRCQGHGRAGMAALGRLDGIHRQRSNRVNRQRIDRAGRGAGTFFDLLGHPDICFYVALYKLVTSTRGGRQRALPTPLDAVSL